MIKIEADINKDLEITGSIHVNAKITARVSKTESPDVILLGNVDKVGEVLGKKTPKQKKSFDLTVQTGNLDGVLTYSSDKIYSLSTSLENIEFPEVKSDKLIKLSNSSDFSLDNVLFKSDNHAETLNFTVDVDEMNRNNLNLRLVGFYTNTQGDLSKKITDFEYSLVKDLDIEVLLPQVGLNNQIILVKPIFYYNASSGVSKYVHKRFKTNSDMGINYQEDMFLHYLNKPSNISLVGSASAHKSMNISESLVIGNGINSYASLRYCISSVQSFKIDGVEEVDKYNYKIINNILLFNRELPDGSIVDVDYTCNTNELMNNELTYKIAENKSFPEFTLNNTPNSNVYVVINGVLLNSVDYTLKSNVLTLNGKIFQNDDINIFYISKNNNKVVVKNNEPVSCFLPFDDYTGQITLRVFSDSGLTNKVLESTSTRDKHKTTYDFGVKNLTPGNYFIEFDYLASFMGLKNVESNFIKKSDIFLLEIVGD